MRGIHNPGCVLPRETCDSNAPPVLSPEQGRVQVAQRKQLRFVRLVGARPNMFLAEMQGGCSCLGSASGLPAASGEADDGGMYTPPLGTEVRAQLGRGLQLHVVKEDDAAAPVPLRMTHPRKR